MHELEKGMELNTNDVFKSSIFSEKMVNRQVKVLEKYRYHYLTNLKSSMLAGWIVQ